MTDMERNNELNGMVRDALLSQDPLFEAPPLQSLQKARQLVAFRQTVPAERPDLLTFLMQCLNLRIKLYHILLVAMVLWVSYILLQDKPEEKQEIHAAAFNYGLASANNNTVLCSIGTCKK